MSIAKKKDEIRKALHTAWGHAKESPNYDKHYWRVLSCVIERITSGRPETDALLEQIELPADLRVKEE